jgi:hypothetical protein
MEPKGLGATPTEAENNDFLFIWNWERLRGEEYETLTNSQVPEHSSKMERLHNVVQMLEDAEQYKKRKRGRLREAIDGYECEVGK